MAYNLSPHSRMQKGNVFTPDCLSIGSVPPSPSPGLWKGLPLVQFQGREEKVHPGQVSVWEGERGYPYSRFRSDGRDTLLFKSRWVPPKQDQHRTRRYPQTGRRQDSRVPQTGPGQDYWVPSSRMARV